MYNKISQWGGLALLFTLAFVGLCDEGSLKIKNWQSDDDIEKVDDDRSNLYIEKGNGDANIAETPENTSAYRVASRTKNIEWRPKWYYSGIGGVRIADAALSSDNSLLALAENTGKPSSLSGSRIVLLNTLNNRVIGIVELPRRKVNRLCFIPGTEKIVCAAERQIQIKQPVSLLLVDCASREIIAVNETFSEKVRDLAVSKDGSNIFTLTEDSNQISMLKPEEWTKNAETLKNDASRPALLSVSIGNILLVPSTGKIRQYDAVTGQYFNLIKLPDDFTPTAIVQAPESKNMVLLEDGGRAYILKGDKYKKFFDESGNLGAYLSAMNAFMMLNQAGSLNLFDLPGYEFRKEFIKPRNIKPKTMGNILKLWYLPPPPEPEKQAPAKTQKGKVKKKSEKKKIDKNGRVMIFDSHGNLMTLELNGKRWRKDLIFSAKR